MGRGSSKLSGGGAGAGGAYQRFVQMSDDEKAEYIESLARNDVDLPDYLDDSKLQKLVYSLGMTEKPKMVDDATLDSTPGVDIFRGVHDADGVTSDAILDQIAYGDYTQFSNTGGSVYGRGIYFSNDVAEATGYANGGMVMRSKMSPDAHVIDFDSGLDMYKKARNNNDRLANACGRYSDGMSSYLLAKGYDAYTTRGGYTIVLNRGAMLMSKTKKVADMNKLTMLDAKWDDL